MILLHTHNKCNFLRTHFHIPYTELLDNGPVQHLQDVRLGAIGRYLLFTFYFLPENPTIIIKIPLTKYCYFTITAFRVKCRSWSYLVQLKWKIVGTLLITENVKSPCSHNTYNIILSPYNRELFVTYKNVGPRRFHFREVLL